MATDALIRWMEDHEYGDYDYGSITDYETHAQKLHDDTIARTDHQKAGKAAFQKFINKGGNYISDYFPNLQDRDTYLKTIEEEINTGALDTVTRIKVENKWQMPNTPKKERDFERLQSLKSERQAELIRRMQVAIQYKRTIVVSEDRQKALSAQTAQELGLGEGRKVTSAYFRRKWHLTDEESREVATRLGFKE